MASDTEQAAQILRGHEKRISRLEERDQPDVAANLIREVSDDEESSDSASGNTDGSPGLIWDGVGSVSTDTSTSSEVGHFEFGSFALGGITTSVDPSVTSSNSELGSIEFGSFLLGGEEDTPAHDWDFKEWQ